MARTKLTMTRDMRYGTRMLSAGDPIELDGPKARMMVALGYGRHAASEAAEPKAEPEASSPEPNVPAAKPDSDDDLDGLRADYEAKFDKKADKRWGAETLREKIAEAKD